MAPSLCLLQDQTVRMCLDFRVWGKSEQILDVPFLRGRSDCQGTSAAVSPSICLFFSTFANSLVLPCDTLPPRWASPAHGPQSRARPAKPFRCMPNLSVVQEYPAQACLQAPWRHICSVSVVASAELTVLIATCRPMNPIPRLIGEFLGAWADKQILKGIARSPFTW